MVLPAKFKSNLPKASEGSIVLTRGFEPCITVYPLQEWQKIFERVAALDEFNPEYRRFQRNFLRGNTEIELDKSGRFLVPRTMARYAQLEREAILIGIGNRIEIWNPDLYEEFLINDQEEFSALAQRFLSKDKGLAPSPEKASDEPASVPAVVAASNTEEENEVVEEESNNIESRDSEEQPVEKEVDKSQDDIRDS